MLKKLGLVALLAAALGGCYCGPAYGVGYARRPAYGYGYGWHHHHWHRW